MTPSCTISGEDHPRRIVKTSPVQPGDIVAGKYRVERILGIGNVGAVVAAVRIGRGDRVALKVLLEGRSADEVQRERFLREIRACLRLRNEHTIRVWNAGFLDGGAPYMEMELLDGRDLAAVLAEQGPLPI